MTKELVAEPWRGLSEQVADAIEPELDAITEEILATIARGVPEYARPLEGRFGRGIRTGVGEALRQFVALIRDPESGRESGREVYVQLGRGEQQQGRTLDSLLAAYRLGARVAWRRMADAGRRAGLEADSLTVLAEAMFAYIDELSADSAEGYAQAQAEVEDVRRRRRRELISLLLADPPADPADLAAAARAAAWPLPGRLAAAACAEADLAAALRSLPPDALATVFDGTACLLVPDPEGPRRPEALERAARHARLALGPTVDPADAAESWELALTVLDASDAGLPSRGLVRAEDHLTDLLMLEARPLVARIAARRLAPLQGLTAKAAERMRETAAAYVRRGGNAVAMAEELRIHPQTARYRIARLRELFGEQLDDPDARFELEIALRHSSSRIAKTSSSPHSPLKTSLSRR
jgi:hypothetical protein